MKYHKSLIVLATALLLGVGGTVTAADEESALSAEDAESQTQLEAEYKKALAVAKQERYTAEASMEKARERLHLASEQRTKAVKESAQEGARMRATQEAELAKMHAELNHARRQLQETSREIARVNRDVARARASSETSRYVFSTSDRPVIGVILGEADDVGVKVLGVSPDGPSERAGIKQGDVIVAMGGHALAAVDETGDTKNALSIVMQEIKALEPVIVSVERGEQTLDLTVVPEVREPLTWQSVTRFPSAPAAPGDVVIIERIEVPEIDTAALSQQIEKMRAEIDERRIFMGSRDVDSHDKEWEIDFHEMSEMGNFALHDANVWFGLPMAQGLKLAEIDAGLGEYFKTDRGVLVLKANTDNELQLESGDVILQVGDTEVNAPSEFMRALRDFQSGEELEIDIKRQRKNRTLKAVMPESQNSFFTPRDSKTHTIKITTKSD